MGAWRAVLALTACFCLPRAGNAQVRIVADPNPAPTPAARFGGGRLMKSGVASQFDSLGEMPMVRAGDSVTVYLFPDGNTMGRTVHARVASRTRFQPPVSWRRACDEVAHPGWMYALMPTSRALFAVVIPGVFPRPEVKLLPPSAKAGAWQFFRAVADSAWQRYLAFQHPATERGVEYLHNDFWGAGNDARWNAIKMFGVRGPEGRNYAAFSFSMHDDYPEAPNTSRVWVVDAWGYPVASAIGSIDIYGTVDDGGIDAVVTSSGLIRWDGTQWQFPPVYSEEPCLYHQTMPVPAGFHP